MSDSHDDLHASLARLRGEEDFKDSIKATLRSNLGANSPGGDYSRPVTDQISEITGFRQLVSGYEDFIANVDSKNAKIDEELRQIHARAVSLSETRKQNLVVRDAKSLKLDGVRQVIRTLEDVDRQKARAAEDAETAQQRQKEDRE